MKSEEWKIYRTRFLVKAKQLSSTLTFVDHLGRQHCGRKGDYLVESSDGVLSIAPRRIFEDIYVSMSQLNRPVGYDHSATEPLTDLKPQGLKFQPLEIAEVKFAKSPTARHRPDSESVTGLPVASREEAVRRKLPQSCRVRPSSSGFGVM
jgi:hypothetical protein